VNQPFKLFFDECCSKKLARRIVEIYSECYPDLQTKHLSEFCSGCGTADEDWIPLLEKEKDWIVLTADRGKDPKKQKLPVICGKLGITHISMTPALIKEGYKSQKQAVLCVWQQIMKVGFLPKGTKVSLGFKMIDRGLTRAPWLSIEQKSFEIWCREKGIQTSNLKIKICMPVRKKPD
jgi:hypothetical protein